MTEEEEEKECLWCQGRGELPGSPYAKQFPKCRMCNGTGKDLDYVEHEEDE